MFGRSACNVELEMHNDLIFILEYLDDGIAAFDAQSTSNRNTITEYTARENAKKAEALRKGKEFLVKCHNEKFAEGIVAGFQAMAKDQPSNELNHRTAAKAD